MASAFPDRVFVDFSCDKLRQLCDRICVCLEKLSQGNIWVRGSDNENAVGNLVLHLCGNVRQWIGFGIGGESDIRERSLEFSARGQVGAPELAGRLREAVSSAIQIIRGLTAERLAERTKIQGYDVTVLEAVYHVVEHFAGHAGQIIFRTKQLTGEGLGFYAHLDSRQPRTGNPP